MKSIKVATLFLLFGALIGGNRRLTAQRPSRAVVSVKLVLATDGVHAGEPVKLAAVAEIAPGFHINDHHPSEDYLIPTELKLVTTPKLSVTNLTYPKGELKSFPFSDKPLSVYQGTVVVGGILRFDRSTGNGDYRLTGKFSYQACNDHECLAPTSVPVSLDIKVVKRGVRLKPANAEIFSRIKFN